jgi:FkbM family methyltransferase
MSTPLPETLDTLLAADPLAALESIGAPTRQKLNAAGDRLVLVGAGPFGLDALRACRKAGLHPVAFADNNQRKQGTEISGVPVMSPADAVRKFGQSVVYLISVYTSEAVWAQMTQLGVAPISFGRLSWTFPDVLLPYLSIDNPAVLSQCAGDIRRASGIWADDLSRREFLAQIRWRSTLNPEVLGGHCPAVETLFAPDLIALRDDESFVDCGAFDGDTLEKYLELSGGKFASFAAFEPDSANFCKLEARVEALPAAQRERTHLFPNALGSVPGRIRFDATGTVSSTAGKGDIWVDLVTLDDTVSGFAPTFIKMDIEGAEPDAIGGAAGVIREHRPIMAICLYHATRHLWEIPLFLKELLPSYNLHLRRYSNDCWELICYAIPPHRSIAS